MSESPRFGPLVSERGVAFRFWTPAAEVEQIIGWVDAARTGRECR